MSLLDIHNLNASYGDVQVIFDLSLKVNQGEVVSIIGGNGAGKSTLLRVISGLLPASGGQIIFEEKEIQKDLPENIVAQGIVHVPEGRRLFPLMSVKDNLMVGAYNKRAREESEQTLQEVYSLLPRLEEREDQLAMTLSGGEQQMVAIGRGLMAKPHILMLDEPSLGLAPLLIKDIFETVRKIADQGMTVLMVEQDVRHSLSLSDRGYVLEHGRVVMEGQADQMIDDPHIREAYLGM
ncbi:ABC transporter ATP-binding protein [Desulfogranum japonicum]|uniref:ABC transporter ATP-binding protein n=1 Tax=Desulfogranum japonicum TaxID=231447 RepID=UPI00040A6DFB|nr:ABC transporter ATP-binding protein [Desulfogranum japonicum]